MECLRQTWEAFLKSPECICQKEHQFSVAQKHWNKSHQRNSHPPGCSLYPNAPPPPPPPKPHALRWGFWEMTRSWILGYSTDGFRAGYDVSRWSLTGRGESLWVWPGDTQTSIFLPWWHTLLPAMSWTVSTETDFCNVSLPCYPELEPADYGFKPLQIFHLTCNKIPDPSLMMG